MGMIKQLDPTKHLIEKLNDEYIKSFIRSYASYCLDNNIEYDINIERILRAILDCDVDNSTRLLEWIISEPTKQKYTKEQLKKLTLRK
jgi:predicted TIM-barrel fold metal-dependent hydrolase